MDGPTDTTLPAEYANGRSELAPSLFPACIRAAEALDGEILGRMGTLEARLARDSSERIAAQQVRFKVFYDELGAKRSYVHELEQADSDRFNEICDHLVVLDRSIRGHDHHQIVATYRLLRQDVAARAGGFYSASEFEIRPLVARHPDKRFLELGRSCVLPAYRTKRTVELLWQGIWAYCRRHGIDVMTGCASFAGTVPAAHALPLSFLHHFCRADGVWSAAALPERCVPMDLMPAEAVNAKAALTQMPPLVKGYLRLGARFGDGAVIDQEFCTTDVLVILPVDAINPRYVAHYGVEADRFI